MKRIFVLGCTGSIGKQTLQVVQEQPGQFEIVALCAHRNWELAVLQVLQHKAQFLVLMDPESAEKAKTRLQGQPVQVLQGEEALLSLLREKDYELVVQAITGAAGLPYSVEVLKRGKTLALANKESLVIAGKQLQALAKRNQASIVPIDSEHAAIFQCIQSSRLEDIRKVYLTGSGGPFRDRALEDFDAITPAEALKHPNWSMGHRITIGSATMMNKAFEIIEAHFLFGLRPEQIEVLIHPQSVVHSMVEFVDGNLLAQLGIPDMRIPIQYALHYPHRAPSKLSGFDLSKFRQLQFEKPELRRFPALSLGYQVIEIAGVSGAVLNASDEVATQMFLDGQIRFPEIVKISQEALKNHSQKTDPTLEEILQVDQKTRQTIRERVSVHP